MAAVDSVKPLDPSYRKIHGIISGKLHKGPNLLSAVPSIPTKYQTVVTSNTEAKGFTSQSKRFPAEGGENPGPGYYNVVHQPIDRSITYCSRNGTGGLASKAARIPRNKVKHTPAANAYHMPSVTLSRRDFGLGYSSMFHQPIAVKVDDGKNQTPAPNCYKVSLAYCTKSNNVTAESAFLSKTQRELRPRVTLKGPSPCHYTVKDSITKSSPKIMVSSFKSKTSRLFNPNGMQTPGPGAYHPYEAVKPVKKMYFPKKHYLCLSAPAMPLPKPVPPPGPGQYEIVDYEGPPKHYMTNAVFVSSTGRWSGDIHGKGIPGPASYEPERPGKQSFLYNLAQKWIPA
ncbi:O(6)-methylguanine-induced apoptosis 2 [Latimeria chalumnae]|uniref:O(6)-methylguanine-induced apoptosis 2 n=1 Tax=Latimeria chalumnae TaxID=7897 RepID=UPI00313DCFE2